MPRSVQTFHNSYNYLINRFSNYIASSRSEDGVIQDIDYPIRRLLIEREQTRGQVVAIVYNYLSLYIYVNFVYHTRLFFFIQLQQLLYLART